jgi:hypothetical protein
LARLVIADTLTALGIYAWAMTVIAITVMVLRG